MRKTAIGIALAAAAWLMAGGHALAAGHALFGQRIIIKNKVPDDESKNKLAFSLRGAVPVSPPASTGDPTCGGAGGGGATLEVRSATSGEALLVQLPCEFWEKERRGNGYKYRDRHFAAGPCRSAQIKAGRYLKATCQGRGAAVLDYDLRTGVHQPPVDVVVTLGSAPETYCARFGGSVRKNGTDAKTFLAARAMPPASCPPEAATPTPTPSPTPTPGATP